MPVETNIQINPIQQEEFHAIDKVIMGEAFDIHNTMGRFFDERIYQEELAQRCRERGFEAHRELQLRVTHQDFSKSYFIDMLIERGVIYELKAAETLTLNHENQLITYLLLADMNHGKLINFRPSSVQTRFVSTRLSHADRTQFQLVHDLKAGAHGHTHKLREILAALLADWGAFLDIGLYREAILHFLTGPGTGICPIEIIRGNRVVGTQHMCMLDQDMAWHISAVRRNTRSYEKHIVRLLNHTSLSEMLWINMNHLTITLKTLKK